MRQLTLSKLSNAIGLNYGCGIFVDFQKAFDIVGHHTILKKLEKYGIKKNFNFNSSLYKLLALFN